MDKKFVYIITYADQDNCHIGYVFSNLSGAKHGLDVLFKAKTCKHVIWEAVKAEQLCLYGGSVMLSFNRRLTDIGRIEYNNWLFGRLIYNNVCPNVSFYREIRLERYPMDVESFNLSRCRHE